MKQRQHTFQTLAIEVLTVLLASIISFPLSDAIGVQLSFRPFVIVACYVAIKFIYHICIFLSAHIIAIVSLLWQNSILSNKPTKEKYAFANTSTVTDNNDILMKRMELFHYEYQHEERQYIRQKEKKEDKKLQAVLQYTRNSFRQFDFSEEEIFQICECVRYFVINRQALTNTNIHIKRRVAVTQISLKNFAWNIAFQYNIGRDVTAQFVMHTFHEWFANSTIDTIRKNLRTTTGNHRIKIDEHIVSITPKP